MAGHIQDRWWRDKRDENGNYVLNDKGKRVREKTELYGKGMRYKVRYPDPNGAGEKSESFPDKQLARAQAFLAKVQTDVLTGSYVDPDAGKITFKDYAEQWRKGLSQDLKTRDTMESKLNAQVYEYLGDRALASITTDTIRGWLEWAEKKETLASYRAVVFDIISAILSAAVEDRKIPGNPCKAKSIKRPKPAERKVVPWSDAKLRKVQLALPERYKIVVPIGAGVALRQMEILGLSLDDIDREALELRVTRQIKWIGPTPVFAPPKGGKTRVVPLGGGVLEQIDDYADTYEPISVTLPWERPNGTPVTVKLLIDKENHSKGMKSSRLWHGSAFLDQVWKPAFDRAGLAFTKQQDGMHAMRHFCASHWLAQGVSIKEVSEYLGHHDAGYTIKIYTHLVPSSHQRARLASDQLFKPRRSGGSAASDPGTA